ncbi:MAG: response regulator [Candidatus Riflebacteria bacterium]|nr:response regulator [Candidatus Riflebacteria bacterium]
MNNPENPPVQNPSVGPKILNSRENIRQLLLRMNRFSIIFVIVLATLFTTLVEIIILRNLITHHLTAETEIIARNSAGAVTFGDQKVAEDILASLKDVPNVISGKIFEKDGTLFAKFQSEKNTNLEISDPPFVSNPGVSVSLKTLSIMEAITWKNETIGYVQILYDNTPVVYRFCEVLLALIILGVITILVASYMFSRQLDSISDPIFLLVGIMQAITHDKDYSRRVPVVGPLEVATLADRFNDLLQTTHQWSTEIVLHRENLEKLVEMRTSQWQTAVNNLQAELEERRRTEAELRKKTDELALVSENLSRSLQFEKRFLANVSHEIRTPLNAILGFSNFALQTSLTPKQYDYVSKILLAGTSLLEIINDILDSSKIEAGKLEIVSHPFDLDDVINNTIDIVSHKVQDRGLEFFLDISPEIPSSLLGDSLRIGQILLNLLGNAIKFTEIGEVELKVELSERMDDGVKLVFSVRDTGIGMTDEQMDKLFMPFIQADGSTTRKFGGTGLGLSISKRLVEMMGGEISAESKYGKGSIFRFSIWQKVDTSERFPQKTIPEVLNGLRILLINENLSIQQALMRTLKRFPFHIFAISSTQATLEEIKKLELDNPFRIIVIENKNISEHNIKLIEQIKKSRSRKNVPSIISILSSLSTETRVKLSEIGVDDILKKPITSSTIFNSIVRVLYPEEKMSNNGKISEWGETQCFQSSRVLLVEDNDFNLQIAQELLESWGFTVETAKNGREAIKKVSESKPEPFNMVLMDIQMPEMDGFEATKQIRKDERFRNLPIIAMTANAFVEDKAKALEAGMNDHVGKPIDPLILKDKLHKFLAKFSQSSPQDLSALQSFSPITLTAISGIDVQTALKRLNGNTARYNKLLLKFLETKQVVIDDIQRAIDTKNFEQIRFLAHSLKGVVGNLGMTDLFKISTAFEKSSSEKIETQINAHWQELQISLNETCIKISMEKVKLETSLESNDSFVHQEPASDSIESLWKLGEGLEKQDFAAFEQFEIIQKRWGKQLSFYSEFQLLGQKISSYAFEEALEVLRSLLNRLKKNDEKVSEK